MADTVQVTIKSVKTQVHPSATLVRYAVRNGLAQPVWLVSDDWLVWREKAGAIELGFARTRMQAGVEPFGYFDPQVVEIAPGAEIERDVRLEWPLDLNRVWNAQARAAPKPGKYEVRVRIGYGLEPAPGPLQNGDDVEAPALRWQREAVSAPLEIEVPAAAGGKTAARS